MTAIDFATIKARHPLAKVVNRYAVSQRRVGARIFWLCPFHNEQTPSFTLTPDGQAFICFGCHAKGDLFEFLKRAEGLNIMEAIAFLNENVEPSSSSKRITLPHQGDDCVRRTKAALTIWNETDPAEGTPVNKYLHARGITIQIPPTIRHHPSLYHAPTESRTHAMVAAVQAPDHRIVAIHRTYLQSDGRPVQSKPKKMMLGPCGGNAVQLGLVEDRLLVSEGIENGLSVMQSTGIPTWAALSTSGLRVLDLPKSVCDVIVLADGDDPGESAAYEAALGWKQEGRCVRIASPGNGLDFNDLLLGRLAHHEEGAT